jgi:hypothetical protein
MNKNNNSVCVVCPTSEVEAEFTLFTQRTAKMLKAVQEFINQAAELDEDADDFHFNLAPHLELLTFNLVSVYPTPDHLKTDITTLENVRTYKNL